MSDFDKLKNKTAAGNAPLASSEGMEAKLDALIGSKLRSYYDELMAEPVPSRILDLLAELDAKERDENPGSN